MSLRVGDEIDEDSLARLHVASEFGKVYARTLNWIMIRPRSEREVRDYLRKRELKPVYLRDEDGKARRDEDGKIIQKRAAKVDVDQVVARLLEKKYLDDERFARWWIENRFVKKGVSRRRLELDLRSKGIDDSVMQRLLSEPGRDEESEIRKVIARKRNRYSDDELTVYLSRQGFDYQLVRKILRQTPDF